MASKKEKKTENPNTGHRRFSMNVTDTDERAASRGMRYGLGLEQHLTTPFSALDKNPILISDYF